jgi:hypothetical protein
LSDKFLEEIRLLLERTRADPALFHQLVFEPEKALAKLPFLSDEAKRQILGVSPSNLTAFLIGARAQAAGSCGVEAVVCDCTTVCVCTGVTVCVCTAITCLGLQGAATCGCTQGCTCASAGGCTACTDCTAVVATCGCTNGCTCATQAGTCGAVGTCAGKSAATAPIMVLIEPNGLISIQRLFTSRVIQEK